MEEKLLILFVISAKIIHVIRFKTWRNKNYFSVRVLYIVHFSLYQSLVI